MSGHEPTTVTPLANRPTASPRQRTADVGWALNIAFHVLSRREDISFSIIQTISVRQKWKQRFQTLEFEPSMLHYQNWCLLIFPRRGRAGRRPDVIRKHHASPSKMGAAWCMWQEGCSASKTNFCNRQFLVNHEVPLRGTYPVQLKDQAANLFEVLAWSFSLISVLRTAYFFEVFTGHQWLVSLFWKYRGKICFDAMIICDSVADYHDYKFHFLSLCGLQSR